MRILSGGLRIFYKLGKNIKNLDKKSQNWCQKFSNLVSVYNKAGIFNGQGYNAADTVNKGVDYGFWGVVKPLALKPKLGSLKLGGGYYDGKHSTGSLPTTYKNHYSDIMSYYAQYDYKKLTVSSEYAKKDGHGSSFDKKAEGWYLNAGYFLTDKIQLIARYDIFTPDKHLKHLDITEYTAGLNYFFIDKNLRLQFNYVFVDNFDFKNSHRLLMQTQFLL